jgi:hypothetical protein
MRPLLIISFLLAFGAAFAQTAKLDSLLNVSKQYDSTLLKPQQKVSAVQSSVSHKTDSLQKIYNSPLAKIDSIQSNFQHQTDSIQNSYQARFSKLDAIGSALKKKADSVASLNLPTAKYTHKLDSITQLQQQATVKAQEKIDALKAKTTDKLKTIELPPELQSKVTDATKGVDGFRLPAGKDLTIPALTGGDNPLNKIGNVNLPSVDKVGDVGKLTEGIKMPELGGELKDVQGSIGDISSVTDKAGAYGNDARNLASGNLNEVKEIPQALETKAGDLSGFSKIQGETKVLDEYKDQLGQLQDPEAMKGQVIEKAKEVAIDHFAGKEQVLQKAMDQVAKYKEKYASLQSLEDAKKRRPNEMRGKPIRERLLPGIGFQVHHKNDLLIDFNPYLGYRFSGRFTSGMGWNQRWAYDERHDAFRSRGRIFGPRAYAEFNLFKGFFPRVELEAMNAFVPISFSHSTPDIGRREWVVSAFFGLKKTYRFLKKVNGTTSVMLNLYNPRSKSPYGDVVNVRFGFEFPIKKKHRAKR